MAPWNVEFPRGGCERSKNSKNQGMFVGCTVDPYVKKPY